MQRLCVLPFLCAVFLGSAAPAWAIGSCGGGSDKLKLLGVSPQKGVAVFTGSSTQCETVCSSDGCDGETVTRQVTLFHEFNGNLRPPGLNIHDWTMMEEGAERHADRIDARHAQRVEEERRAVKNLGPLVNLEPATANRPSKSPNGACQASIDFGPLQIPKGIFRFVRAIASVRSNNAELLQPKLASHNPQGGPARRTL
jgi:hypothetical protein